jgi:hypothetical protein
VDVGRNTEPLNAWRNNRRTGRPQDTAVPAAFVGLKSNGSETDSEVAVTNGNDA